MTGRAQLERFLRTDPGAPAKGRYTMAVLLGVLTLPGANARSDTTRHA
jgi:hypothetical protein